MKTVKQILDENSYSTDTNSIVSGLSQLAECGLFDTSKLPIIKRGLTKTNINEMTEAEKKSLQYFIESLMAHVLIEQQDYLTKLDPKSKMAYPSEKDMPSVIILKRKAIRVYPDNQKVALYYSQALDKYVSIPFGPSSKNLGAHLTLNEEHLTEISQKLATRAYVARNKQLDTIKNDPTLTDDERKEKTKIQKEKIRKLALSMSGRIKNPRTGKITREWGGPTALRGAVFATKTPDEQKQIAMSLSPEERANTPGATKAAIKGALGASGHPLTNRLAVAAGTYIHDALIGKKENAPFIKQKRRDEPPAPPSSQPSAPQPSSTPPPSTPSMQSSVQPSAPPPSAQPSAPPSQPNVPVQLRSGAVLGRVMRNRPVRESFKQKLEEKREYGATDAALDAASFLPGPAGSAASLASAGLSLSRGDLSGAALDVAGAIPLVGNFAKAAKVAKTVNAASKTRKFEKLRRVGGAVLNGAGALLGGGGGGGGDGGGGGEPLIKPVQNQPGTPEFTAAGRGAKLEKPTQAQQTTARYNTIAYNLNPTLAASVNEQTNFNKIRIISENKDMESELVYEDSSVTVNNRIAKKIMNLHESLNKRNKKKVEKMINEDVTSFRKVINFAVRQ